MPERIYANVTCECSDDGYLKDFNDWNKEVGSAIATEEGIEMTDRHWEVINYLQEQWKNDVALTIRRVGKSGVIDIKGFYGLFPDGPLKKASRIAGIPKPVSCI